MYSNQLDEQGKELQRKASQWFDEHEKEFIEDLIDWVRIPSVSSVGDASEGEPYGPDVAKMFEQAAYKANEFGFITANHGIALQIEYGKHADDLGEIALVSHLDVVPAGQGWDWKPFEPFYRDGYVVGRGASDNKAGALIDLYLLRFFRDEGIIPRHPLTILYGGAEETTLDDMREYVKRFGAPHQAVVTDSPFPANNAQKGHLVLEVRIPVGSVLRHLQAGVAANAVPGDAQITFTEDKAGSLKRALAQLRNADQRLADSLSVVEESDGGITLTAKGRSGHAAFPEGTNNAITLLVRALADLDEVVDFLDDADRKAVRNIGQWFSDPYAAGTTIAYEDKQSGSTTQNLGILKPAADANALIATVDIRYAVTQTFTQIIQALTETFKTGDAVIDSIDDSKPFYVPADDPRLNALLSAFNAVTGTDQKPNAMGGGTHARVIPGALNFGPGLDPALVRNSAVHVDGRPSFIPDGKGSSHGADEWESIHNSKLAFLIYVEGLLRLDRTLDAPEGDTIRTTDETRE